MCSNRAQPASSCHTCHTYDSLECKHSRFLHDSPGLDSPAFFKPQHGCVSLGCCAAVQVEPLADWHVGSITGVAAAPTGAHTVSCGLDGSIRVWAAAAGGQLVSKRDVGGQLMCGAACSDGKLFAVGSKTGVLRYGLFQIGLVHACLCLDCNCG
jgi:WD40 repeat protein